LTQLTLGATIKYKDRAWRVVRIINKSHSLFEPENASPYVLEEVYAELKSPEGDIDFLVIESEKRDYKGEDSPIKGLHPLPWRKE